MPVDVGEIILAADKLEHYLRLCGIEDLIPRLYLCCKHKNCARSGGRIGGVRLMVCEECLTEITKQIQTTGDKTWKFPVRRLKNAPSE